MKQARSYKARGNTTGESFRVFPLGLILLLTGTRKINTTMLSFQVTTLTFFVPLQNHCIFSRYALRVNRLRQKQGTSNWNGDSGTHVQSVKGGSRCGRARIFLFPSHPYGFVNMQMSSLTSKRTQVAKATSKQNTVSFSFVLGYLLLYVMPPVNFITQIFMSRWAMSKETG